MYSLWLDIWQFRSYVQPKTILKLFTASCLSFEINYIQYGRHHSEGAKSEQIELHTDSFNLFFSKSSTLQNWWKTTSAHKKIIFRFYRTERRGSLLSNVVLCFKLPLKVIKYESLPLFPLSTRKVPKWRQKNIYLWIRSNLRAILNIRYIGESSSTGIVLKYVRSFWSMIRSIWSMIRCRMYR